MLQPDLGVLKAVAGPPAPARAHSKLCHALHRPAPTTTGVAAAAHWLSNFEGSATPQALRLDRQASRRLLPRLLRRSDALETSRLASWRGGVHPSCSSPDTTSTSCGRSSAARPAGAAAAVLLLGPV